MALVSLATGLWYSQTAPEIWQTMVFTTLTLSQLSHVMAIRSGNESLFRVGPLSNKLLLGAVALTFALQLLAIYLPSSRDSWRQRRCRSRISPSP